RREYDDAARPDGDDGALGSRSRRAGLPRRDRARRGPHQRRSPACAPAHALRGARPRVHGAERDRARAHPGNARASGDRADHRQVDRPARALAQGRHHPPRSGAGRARARRARGRATAPGAASALMAVGTRARHFVSLGDLDPRELRALLERAASLKASRARHEPRLAGRTLALIFEKPSLRTRLSFDVGMRELGGHCIYLSPQEVGLGRRESVADVARVVSRMVDAVVLRTNAHETIEEFAKYSSVPVINGLSDLSHPCQGLADIMTIVERKGPELGGVTVAYVGDGNNVLHSLMLATALRGARLRAATPEGF